METRDALGRIYVTQLAVGTPVFYNRGMAFDSQGRLHVTIGEDPTDVWVGGIRLSATGQVVHKGNNPVDIPNVFNQGLPFSKVGGDGRLISQDDQTPGANDPYVAGVRVGPLGGVYFQTGNLAPTVLVQPSIIGPVEEDTAELGSDGAANGVPLPVVTARQWYIDSVAIPGATTNTYTPTTADVGKALTYGVTWTNAAGQASGLSAPRTVIPIPGQFGIDLDADGKVDTIVFAQPPVTISVDEDSINIDLDGDGNADTVIPRP